jgi:hypothetical protein
MQPAVRRVDRRRADEAPERERQVVNVAVDRVELVRSLEALRELDDVGAGRVTGVRVEAERPYRRGRQACARARVAAREQGDVVASPGELLREVGHHAFRSTVERRRHALVEGRDLRDPHGRGAGPWGPE